MGRPGWEPGAPQSLPTHSALSPSRPGDLEGGGGPGRRERVWQDGGFRTRRRHLRQPRLGRAVNTAKEGIFTTRRAGSAGPAGLARGLELPLLRNGHAPWAPGRTGVRGGFTGTLDAPVSRRSGHLRLCRPEKPWVSPPPQPESLFQKAPRVHSLLLYPVAPSHKVQHPGFPAAPGRLPSCPRAPGPFRSLLCPAGDGGQG